jgi:nucleoside-diphosphate-sugar epimerase
MPLKKTKQNMQNNEDTNILLTGGSGFFGKYLKAELAKTGNVTTIGISDSDDVFFDLSSGVPELKKRFEFVVHAAGKAHVIPRNKEEIESFYNINYKGTVNLLRAFDTQGTYPEKFVFISTVAVYGLESGEGIKETAMLKAVDPYGKSKVMAEKALQEWGEKNNVIVTILRLPLLIGRNAPGNLGAMISAIKKGRFAIIGKGNTKRSMVFAGDVAAFIPQIAKTGGVYNLTDGHHPTYKELAETIGRKLNKRPYFIIPAVVATLMAKTADIMQKVLHKDLPFSSGRLKKLTSSLTFDDSKARKNGWRSGKVTDIVDEWL